jgi:Skp family chaperone for outer membrane proteins
MKCLAPFALSIVASLMTTPLLAADDAEPLTGCAAKRQAISTQIEQAKAHANSEQQAGLEKALSEVTAHCNDATLKKERENKVLDAKHEVSRRQADLDKAMKKGDPDKINKRKDKLAESRKELQNAVEELDQ